MDKIINRDNVHQYAVVEPPSLRLSNNFGFWPKSLRKYSFVYCNKRVFYTHRDNAPIDPSPLIINQVDRREYGKVNLHKVYEIEYEKNKRIQVAYLRSYGIFLTKVENAEILLQYFAKISQLESNKIKPVEVKTYTIVEQLEQYLNTLYINDEEKSAILDALTPFVSTFKNRQIFDINSCLSIIFTGSPGDGKTYNAKSILWKISKLIRLGYVEEEALTFQKAAKLEANFCALIDDMNISHFQRNAITGSICQNILSEMDKPGCNRLFILTTNETITKQHIDPAFFRPGRVQSIIKFERSAPYIKQRIIDDTENLIKSKKISISKEMKHVLQGLKFLTGEDNNELSLAEMMRLKNLFLTDLVMGTGFNKPEFYIEKCKGVEVPSVGDDSYAQAIE